MAMKPLAPGLFSTTTCRPHCFDSFSAIRRMKIDGATPGECGMVILTVLVGNACENAVGAASSQAATKAAISSSFAHLIVRYDTRGPNVSCSTISQPDKNSDHVHAAR